MARIASRCGIALFFMALACGGPRWHTSASGAAPRSEPQDLPPTAATPTPVPAEAPQPSSPTPVAAPSSTPVVVHRSTPADSFERDYPLHGLAFHALAQVFSEPSERAVVVGYFRRGGRLRAKQATRGKGCDTRWHAVFGGGFICAGRGFLLGKTPPSFAPLPEPPSLHEALPYAYSKTTAADTPLFFRAPTPQEEQQLSSSLATRLAIKQHPQRSVTHQPAAKLAKLLEPKPSTLLDPDVAPLPDVVRMLMQPGYYVSVDAHQEEDFALLRTVRGDLVRPQGQAPVKVSGLHGSYVEPSEASQLALVYRAGAPSFTRDPMSGALSRAEPLRALQPVYLSAELVRDRQREYRVTRDGLLVPLDALRIVPHTPRPPFVPAGARYIAIQLSTQTLVAYDGNTPVFATLVSTGKAEHETPTGIFRIQQKHVSATMDGEAGSDEAYSIEDVPWTMYFSGSLALHAAFWHERFGRPRSHGCVNLAPLDARWLFEWAGPKLPLGFHGVVATAENLGTFVVIAP